MENILLHNIALQFVQCSKDISMFDEQGFEPFLSLEKTIIGFLERKMVKHIVSKNGVATDPE
jgi:hypothetical protein